MLVSAMSNLGHVYLVTEVEQEIYLENGPGVLDQTNLDGVHFCANNVQLRKPKVCIRSAWK